MRPGSLPALGFALVLPTGPGFPDPVFAGPGAIGAEPPARGPERGVAGAAPEVVGSAGGVSSAEPGAAGERAATGSGVGRAEECPPPAVSLRGAWSRPAGHEWTSRAGLEPTGAPAETRTGTPTGTLTGARSGSGASPGAAGSMFETLGRIEVASVSAIGTRSATSCRADRCLVCPPEVEGVFGYEFHRILLARDLEGAECHREAALAHEMRHADLYAEAERRFLPQLRERLRARLSRWAPVRTTRAGTEAVSARWQAALEEEIARTAERMNRDTDARQALLDTEDAYRRWSAETEARCGPFPTPAPGRR